MPRGRKKKITGEVPLVESTEIIVPTVEQTKFITETKQKDDLGTPMQGVKKDSDHAVIIISWKDKQGRSRTTQYIMNTLHVNEGIVEEFEGAKKKTFLSISLDGTVLEKI